MRWLWPEAIRVLAELRPTWAVFENPVGIASLGELGSLAGMADKTADEIPDIENTELLNIIRDIEAQGYEVQPVSISACAVGAPHRRQRIFIIAHCKSPPTGRLPIREIKEDTGFRKSDCDVTNPGISRPQQGLKIEPDSENWESQPIIGRSNQFNPDSKKQGLERSESEGNCGAGGLSTELGIYTGWSENWIEVARRLCSKTQSGVRSLDAGTSTGLPGLNLSRTAKLKMLGNCNPPQQYYPIFKAIADTERQKGIE